MAVPYIGPTFEDSHQANFSKATDYDHLANHLKDLNRLDNLDYLLVKSHSSTKEIPHDDIDNSCHV